MKAEDWKAFTNTDIAYNKGKTDGIREVVEWIEQQSDIMTFINMHCEEKWNEMVANIR